MRKFVHIQDVVRGKVQNFLIDTNSVLCVNEYESYDDLGTPYHAIRIVLSGGNVATIQSATYLEVLAALGLGPGEHDNG